MKRIETAAFARAGLVGNPSDGYFGKTISFTIRDFAARVVIYSWPTLEILPSPAELETLGKTIPDYLRVQLFRPVGIGMLVGGASLEVGSFKRIVQYQT